MTWRIWKGTVGREAILREGRNSLVNNQAPDLKRLPELILRITATGEHGLFQTQAR